MGYNTDWDGQLKTNRAFTKEELTYWNTKIRDTRHDDELHPYGDPKRIMPSIWCGFMIENRTTNWGEKYGVFFWDGGEKTYMGRKWIEFFLNKLHEWSKKGEEIYAEGEMEWDGEESNDLGRVVVEKCIAQGGVLMHVDAVEFRYNRKHTTVVNPLKPKESYTLKE